MFCVQMAMLGHAAHLQVACGNLVHWLEQAACLGEAVCLRGLHHASAPAAPVLAAGAGAGGGGVAAVAPLVLAAAAAAVVPPVLAAGAGAAAAAAAVAPPVLAAAAAAAPPELAACPAPSVAPAFAGAPAPAVTPAPAAAAAPVAAAAPDPAGAVLIPLSCVHPHLQADEPPQAPAHLLRLPLAAVCWQTSRQLGRPNSKQISHPPQCVLSQRCYGHGSLALSTHLPDLHPAPAHYFPVQRTSHHHCWPATAPAGTLPPLGPAA
eukprot:829021-Pelagomonas_calceolata.AAC.6